MEIAVGILVISDRVFRGEAIDESGPALIQYLHANSHLCKFNNQEPNWKIETKIVPDEVSDISKQLLQWCDEKNFHLILTTGGTGFAPRDVTPEATKSVLEKEATGLQIAMLNASLRITPHAMLSRAVAGIRKNSIIINLPGSPKGAVENLDAIFSALPHAISLVNQFPQHSHPSSHRHPQEIANKS
jgi:molybdenum cofactor synthesis domain-containing protein